MSSISLDDSLELDYLISKLSPEDVATIRSYREGADLDKRTTFENARFARAVHALSCAANADIRCSVCNSAVKASHVVWNSFAAKIRRPCCINCETAAQRHRRASAERQLIAGNEPQPIWKRLMLAAKRANRLHLARVAMRLLPKVGIVALSAYKSA